jgi:hypothetical protein
MSSNTTQIIDVALKILDIIKGSPEAIQTREITAKLFNIYGIKLPTFKVREILWSQLKDEISYRGKPYWDYRIKTSFKVDLKFKRRQIIYISSPNQPLFSLQISHLNSEIIYFINKNHNRYSLDNDETLQYILNAWEELIIADENGLSTFYKFITFLK